MPRKAAFETRSFSELMQAQQELEAAIETVKKRERPTVLANIRQAIAMFGFTEAELFADESGKQTDEDRKRRERSKAISKGMQAAAQKKKAAGKPARKKSAPEKGRVKYQHGDLKWSGYGPAPKWMQELEAAGRKREEFRVKPA